MSQMSLLPLLSAIFGWVYTIAWSLSFYPQPALNLRRRSTVGTTVDFPIINCLGFLCYFIYNTVLYTSPLLRSQYAARNNGSVPAVRLNDIVFAAHAFLLSVILTSQYFLPALWRMPPQPASSTRPSRLIVGIFTGSLVGIAAVAALVWAAPQPLDSRGYHHGSDSSSSDSSSSDSSSSHGLRGRGVWCELDIAYALSYVKLLVSVIKYTPQVVANFRNRSTRGWSIWQPLLDFCGGVLSIAQLVLDSFMAGGDWAGVAGNPVKFALGNVSIAYDVVFMLQHYVLYRHARHDEAASLLRTASSAEEDVGVHRRLD